MSNFLAHEELFGNKIIGKLAEKQGRKAMGLMTDVKIARPQISTLTSC